jgi:succinate dehydrogenase/fumarate reductase flavoprotein subunit
MDTKLSEEEEYDVLVIGRGTAGLRAGVEALSHSKRVLIISNGGPCTGIVGFNVPLEEGGDKASSFMTDILANGKYISDIHLSSILANRSVGELRMLEHLGLSFTHDKDRYLPRLTSGNRYPRTVYRSDTTGLDIIDALSSAYKRRGGGERRDEYALRILTKDNSVVGLVTYNEKSGEYHAYRVPAIIIATGGLGPLYSKSTNSPILNGDGLALALEAGAELRDLEFIQFEPFLMLIPEISEKFSVSFLLHDKPRIYNKDKETIFPKDFGELNKGDLSRFLYREIKSGRATEQGGIYFDCTHFTEEQLNNHQRFLSVCGRHGIDPGVVPFEISPAQHNILGGIMIDSEASTSVNGLFAAGEVSGGVHGADRLAGNSGSDALVFGAVAGKSASQYARDHRPESKNQIKKIADSLEFNYASVPFDILRKKIGNILWNTAGIIRTGSLMRKGIKELNALEEEYMNKEGVLDSSPIAHLRSRNALTLAKLIIQAALLREESRGVHFREDFPEQNDESWLKSIMFAQRNNKIVYRCYSQLCRPLSSEWNEV